MRLRIKAAWIVAGLVAVGAMLAHEQDAQAAGISIMTGNSQQNGDPTYEYIFQVELLAGSTLQNGGFFTVYDIPSLNPSFLSTSQPNINWGSSFQDTGLTPAGATVFDDPSILNVTWQWNGSSPIVAPSNSNLVLGTFTAGTTYELTSPPTPTLVYVGTLDGVTESNQGSITVSAIPEPSSVILVLAGTGMIPLLYLRERRRCERQNRSQLQSA